MKRSTAISRLESFAVEEPASGGELAAQVLVERDVARRHLVTVTESFHDPGWRREHRGDGDYPENHLWSATAAYLELDDALQRLDH